MLKVSVSDYEVFDLIGGKFVGAPVFSNSGLIHLFMQHCTLSQAHSWPSQVSSMPKEGRKIT